MTLNKLFAKLRRQNKGQYVLLGFCIFLSVILITSFALMYFGPTVQNFLPEGGDTRKMANLLIAATAVGCLIFTLYASGLFFRYKSREYGIFLALGTPKSKLVPLLFKELATLVLGSSVLGLICAIPLSFGIWKIFELFIISSADIKYRFGISGFVVGILFAGLLALCLCIYGLRFVKQSNVMDILRTAHKTEMVKEIHPKTGKFGLALIVLGFFFGLILPQITGNFFFFELPSIFSLSYLLVVAGIYMFMLSLVAQQRLGRHRRKYYRNLVSISLMRFSAKATTRNMCVITLLLFSGLFAAFWGMLYATDSSSSATNARAYTMHFPVLEEQITTSDIQTLAKEHQVTITEYAEETAASLVISFKVRDFVDNKYVTRDSSKEKLSLFFSASAYKQLTGRNVSPETGTYQTITTTDYKESIWKFIDGLYAVTNPDTGETKELSYGGSLEFDTLADIGDPYTYVISDTDYDALTTSLSPQYQERLFSFNVADLPASYPFAKALETEYTAHASDKSDYMDSYDAWEAKLAKEKGEDYSYAESVNPSSFAVPTTADWKYAPGFSIIAKQDFLQSISIYIMLCLYIFIITLVAVSTMSYVRSISVATDNRELFNSLKKLGADYNYNQTILKKQLAKFFQFPALMGGGIAWLFALTMCFINDGRLMIIEVQSMLLLMGLILIIWSVLFGVYRKSLKQAIVIAEI